MRFGLWAGALAVVAATMLLFTSVGLSQAGASATSAYARMALGVPSGPVSSVSDCPSTPRWTPPLPYNASQAPPTLSSGQCTYDVRYVANQGTATDTDSSTSLTPEVVTIAYHNEGDRYQVLTTVDSYKFDTCTFSLKGGNNPTAYAIIRNNSGDCNTTGPLSTVWVFNKTTFEGGPARTATFHVWSSPSTITKHDKYGSWEIFVEKVIGTHGSYNAYYGSNGPSL